MTVRFETPEGRDGVALVTIDRPEKANSLDPPTLSALAAAWERIRDDDAICAAVLTGAGDRVFCAGMDMARTIPASQSLARGERVSDEDFQGLRAVRTATLAGFDMGKPLVCAINGDARAGGFDLMLAAEMRFAVPTATFALEEVALGLYPTGNATVLLPKQIGHVHANKLLLTAQPIDAEEARRIGLVNDIVARQNLLEHALDAAATIAANAPLAVCATRRGLREIAHLPLAEAYARQEELGRPLRATEDAREAQRAFVEKRKPIWKKR